MRRSFVGIALLVVVAAVAVLVGSACTVSPALRVNVADGVSDVPLGAPLEVTAASARVDQAVLQRIDVPSAPIELARTDSGAKLSGPLEPDARYRLLVSAEPDQGTPLPCRGPRLS